MKSRIETAYSEGYTPHNHSQLLGFYKRAPAFTTAFRAAFRQAARHSPAANSHRGPR